jgi:hypothetical protein
LSTYKYSLKDNSDSSKGTEIDFRKSVKREKEEGKIYLIKLKYRAKNGSGAVRLSNFYCPYYKNDTIIFTENDCESEFCKKAFMNDFARSFKIN